MSLSAWEPIPVRELTYLAPANIDSRIFIDFETNTEALDGGLTDVFLLVIVDQFGEAYSYYANDFLDTNILQDIQEWFDRHVVVMHNAAFDIWVAAQLGLRIHKYECTYVLSYCVQPSAPNSLGGSAEYYGLKENKGTHEDFTKFSRAMEDYCIQDCVTTSALWDKLTSLPCCSEPSFEYIYFSVELPFILVLLELNHTGVYVDKEKWQEVIDEVTNKRDELLEEIHRIAPLAPGKKYKTKRQRPDDQICEGNDLINGKFIYQSKDRNEETADAIWVYRKIEPYNPGSTQQTAWLLEHMYGWMPTELTASQEAKIDKQILKELPYELAGLLVEYNRLNKIVTTYGEKLLEQVGEDGRLRSNYNQCVTLTGRLSSSSVNLQNIPARGELGDSIRKLFIASPGMVMVGCDVDSFQVRIVAYYLAIVCPDNNDAWAMFNEFVNNPDADPHQVNADLIGCERKVAKNCLFGDLFGFGAAKFAAMSGLSIADANGILEQQREMMPSMQELKEYVWEYTRSNGGVVEDLYGRRGVYYDILREDNKEFQKRAERQAFNFLIQSTEASIIKQWLILVREALRHFELNCNILLQVHDEILLECYSEDIDRVKWIVQHELQDNQWLGDTLPVTGTPTVGSNWYEVH